MSCFVWLVQPNDLNNTHLSYDKNGNITSLHRSEGGGYYLDELDYVYNGNQVVEISDRSGDMGMQEVKEYRDYHTEGDDFTYDANGNMTVDLDRNIVAIRYNLLNLPDTIQFKNGNQLINQYDAAGCLLQRESVALHSPMSVPLTNVCTYNYDADVMSLEKELYMDNCEYTLQKRGLETIIRSSRYNNNEGYTLESGMMGMHHFYQCKDHLGSVRELFYVDNNRLYTLQTTEYYADGLPTLDSTGESAALEKYNGKKYIEMHGYDCSDYGARHYYPTIGRFTSVDPLAEKYPSISPYAYCANNPIICIDPDGMDIVVITNGGKRLFSLNDGNKVITTLTARQIYNRGIQWFESSADNYMPLISKAEGLSTFSELKHFSWNEVAEFAETDRWMLSYRSGGSGDWKADGKPGDGYLMVTVGGEPFWTDAIGQIPFSVNKFTDELEKTGNAKIARQKTIEAGQTFGDGNVIGGESDNTNSYDNAMIKRAINWAEKRHKVIKGSGWFWDKYDLKKNNHSPSNLSKQSDEKQ